MEEIGRNFRFLLTASIDRTIAMMAIATTPTPIPAFTPIDRPEDWNVAGGVWIAVRPGALVVEVEEEVGLAFGDEVETVVPKISHLLIFR